MKIYKWMALFEYVLSTSLFIANLLMNIKNGQDNYSLLFFAMGFLVQAKIDEIHAEVTKDGI